TYSKAGMDPGITLSLPGSPSGTPPGTPTDQGTNYFPSGTQITLAANPAPWFTTDYWTINGAGSYPDGTVITLTSPTTATAFYNVCFEVFPGTQSNLNCPWAQNCPATGANNFPDSAIALIEITSAPGSNGQNGQAYGPGQQTPYYLTEPSGSSCVPTAAACVPPGTTVTIQGTSCTDQGYTQCSCVPGSGSCYPTWSMTAWDAQLIYGVGNEVQQSCGAVGGGTPAPCSNPLSMQITAPVLEVPHWLSSSSNNWCYANGASGGTPFP
ncbi:MAG: hypothetical protein KGH64_06205, partial [Candidatus Micrarchaeota archaeon]|nr:hypothetical protein [Candidatus Micrarchaeota archaeon]